MVQISSDWANLKYALYGITLFAAVTIIVEQVLGPGGWNWGLEAWIRALRLGFVL